MPFAEEDGENYTLSNCILCGKNGQDLRIYCVCCSSAAHPGCLDKMFCACWSPSVAREVTILRKRISELEHKLDYLPKSSKI